jgi:hypothetical protein
LQYYSKRLHFSFLKNFLIMDYKHIIKTEPGIGFYF